MSERVVLAHRTSGFLPFQWTDEAPEGLDDEDVALACGGRWEGEELVTYDMSGLRICVDSQNDDFLNDND
ncbi:MAG: hypothetical protein M3291_06275 [Actinomycetota bacterium]|nr:hypothetical protein [Actinomycetota bacterium]